MAFDVFLADRIRSVLNEEKLVYQEKKMMGGLIFMVNGKMCLGTHIDKKIGDSLLMLKIGEQAYQYEIKKTVCLPMDFTGRPMIGFIFVTPEGFDNDRDLQYWINKAVTYNKQQRS